VTLSSGLAIIATVGQGMAGQIGMASRLTTALAEAKVNLQVIDQGSSENNIIIGVDEAAFEDAVRAIYAAFTR
jgi:aspartate kinase